MMVYSMHMIYILCYFCTFVELTTSILYSSSFSMLNGLSKTMTSLTMLSFKELSFAMPPKPNMDSILLPNAVWTFSLTPSISDVIWFVNPVVQR